MLFRVFGRKNVKGVKFFDTEKMQEKKSYINVLNQYRFVTGKMCNDMCDETVKFLEKLIDQDDTVIFIDMGTSDGIKMSQEENVFYVPTIVCINKDEEVGCIEMQGPYNTEELNDANKNASAKWWGDIGKFVRDMKSEDEDSKKDYKVGTPKYR